MAVTWWSEAVRHEMKPIDKNNGITTKQRCFGMGGFNRIPEGTGADRLSMVWTDGVETRAGIPASGV